METEEKKKRIFDVNCITCKHFFTCNGMAEEGQLCVLYEERGDSTWQAKECSR